MTYDKAKIDQLTSSAVNLGFDSNWIIDLLEKHGAEIVALVVEAARQGLSVSLIIEVIDKLGPDFLRLIVDILSAYRLKQAHKSVAGEIIPGPIWNPGADINSSILDVLIEKYLPIFINQVLPVLLEKYGQQIIQAILTILLKNIQK